MTLLRSQEARVLPGKRQKWGENARKVKDTVAGHGVEIRYFQATLGAVPGTIVSGSLADDWPALASRSTAINEDPKFQALMQEVNNDPDGQVAEPLSLTLYEDINEQLGGAAPQVENATVYQATRFRILPGRRANALELLRQVREAIGGAGRQIPSGWEVAVGEAGILLAITAYESLAALAEARSQGQAPGVQEILQKAQADSKFPYFEPVDTRILTDITDQL